MNAPAYRNQRRVPGRATSAAVTKASTDTYQVAIRFALKSGESMTAYLPLTSKAMEYTEAALRNCGWKGDDIRDLSTVCDNEVELVIQEEEHQGEWTPRIRFINAPLQGIPEDELERLQAKVGPVIAALKGGAR